jgi:dihydrofolate synthase/folylpolyglutamate synthase
MDYADLMARLTRRGLFHIKPGLERVHRVLLALGDPQNALKTIHIAGTNGKGSVAAYLESMLRHSGLRTGLYTSPHLWDVRERIQINRKPISATKFWEVGQRVLNAESQTGVSLTYFEFLTVMAFLTFQQDRVEAAVIEAGMGGRWDATNVLAQPALTAITSIGLDHMKWLGRTEEAIAREKSGIIKPGVPLVCGARGVAARVMENATSAKKSQLFQIDKQFHAETQSVDWRKRQRITYTGITGHRRSVDLGLLGTHQTDNAAVALAGLEILQKNGWAISDSAVARGMAEANWPGRFQLMRTPEGRLILFDGAHNPPALERLLSTLDESPWARSCKTFVFGVYRDKDYKRMLKRLRPHAVQIIACTMPGKRALPAQAAAEAMRSFGSVRTISDPHRALQTALETSDPTDLVVVTGSLTLVGILLQSLRGGIAVSNHGIASATKVTSQ